MLAPGQLDAVVTLFDQYLLQPFPGHDANIRRWVGQAGQADSGNDPLITDGADSAVSDRQFMLDIFRFGMPAPPINIGKRSGRNRSLSLRLLTNMRREGLVVVHIPQFVGEKHWAEPDTIWFEVRQLNCRWLRCRQSDGGVGG
jgi:hypothetical protein